MKQVKRSPLFLWEAGRKARLSPMDSLLGVYFSQRRALNSFMVFAICLVVFALTALFQRWGWVFGLSFLSYFLHNYFQLKKIAHGIEVTRSAPSKAREGEEVEVTLKIRNTSPFLLERITVRDQFEGTQKPDFEAFVERVSVGRYVTLKYKMKCDGGMGRFHFKNLELRLSDALGLFEYVIEEDYKHQLDVYPLIQEIPEIEVKGSPYSILYGIYDEPSVGSSVNFIGIREYVRGDSLRHIAWKLSAKRGKLLVKEFEKLVNTDVSIVLNMDQRRHVGIHGQSTWEYSKDLCLSLLRQEIENGNSVQLLSQNYYLPLGRGESQAQTASLSLHPVMPQKEVYPLLNQYDELISRGTTLFYVTPFWLENISEDMDRLLKYRAEGVQVSCFFLEPRSFAKDKLHGLAQYFLLGSEKAEQDKKISQLCQKLKSVGVQIYWVHRKHRLSEAIKKEVGA